MFVTQDHLNAGIPMGANLLEDGASFRVWAPNAIAVHLRLNKDPDFTPTDANKLTREENGYWSGFVAEVTDGTTYRFWVQGKGSSGYKRDPYARELEFNTYPNCDCIVRAADSYRWHDAAYRRPASRDLVIHQFHIGRYYSVDDANKDNRASRIARFLDVLKRLDYLTELGVNAIEPLPITEFAGETSMGYNGTDMFSPEMDYAVPADELAPYVTLINNLLRKKIARNAFIPLTVQDLTSQVNQVKALIDLCHLYGIAVIFDVVYNHAGGFDNDDECLYFFDRDVTGNNNNSQYFTDVGHAGGLVFAFWKREVRQFLIDNAMFFLGEYHVDGLRYDQVTVMDENGGWQLCQDLTNTVHYHYPDRIHIAEYWGDRPWAVKPTAEGGAGFDAVWNDTLRDTTRNTLCQAGCGTNTPLNYENLCNALSMKCNGDAWRNVQCIENHDITYYSHDRACRAVRLADPLDSRSWYARSRTRVGTGILLTAPGIPMLFMGEEFLEDKCWHDNIEAYPYSLIWWDGLQQDKNMRDFLRFTRNLITLRQQFPALRGEGIHTYHRDDNNRILAFHRWVEGSGQDVVIVVSLCENTFFDYSYQIGFPCAGHWQEIFNSDYYDNCPNPRVEGNPGGVTASGPPIQGGAFSTGITIPENSIIVFTLA